MKKISLLILIIMIPVLFTGCENKEETQTFKATIIECKEDSMIVRPEEDESEFKSSDRFNVSFTGNYNTCKVDGKVKITYTGFISESYPAQIDTIKIEDIK